MTKPLDVKAIMEGEADLQQKAEDTGLYTDEDEDEDNLFITDK